MITHVRYQIKRETHLLLKFPTLFILRWYTCFVLNTVFGVRKDISYTDKQTNITITFPNEIGITYVFMEIFVYKVFDEMRDLNCVLDLGGFIGESALLLAQQNKEVYCYELSEKNYKYLEINCSHIQNIHHFHAGISLSNDSLIHYIEEDIVSSTMATTTTNSAKSKQVRNIAFTTLLKEHNFDGIKIDIEGGEYEILPVILTENLLTFSKGIIEFHDLTQDEKFLFLKSFLDYLQQKGYVYELFTNEREILHIENMQGQIAYCNVLFQKDC